MLYILILVIKNYIFEKKSKYRKRGLIGEQCIKTCSFCYFRNYFEDNQNWVFPLRFHSSIITDGDKHSPFTMKNLETSTQRCWANSRAQISVSKLEVYHLVVFLLGKGMTPFRGPKYKILGLLNNTMNWMNINLYRVQWRGVTAARAKSHWSIFLPYHMLLEQDVLIEILMTQK